MRVMAATHRDLVRAGSGRGVSRRPPLIGSRSSPSTMPPLRHRRGDLPDLLAHFLTREKAREASAVVRATVRARRDGAPPRVRLASGTSGQSSSTSSRGLSSSGDRPTSRSPITLPNSLLSKPPAPRRVLGTGVADSRGAAALCGLGPGAARWSEDAHGRKAPGIDDKTLAKWLAARNKSPPRTPRADRSRAG